MLTHGNDLLTVSPPRLDRTDFARLDRSLPRPLSPYDRGWIMARFREGLQIRLLRRPSEGMVLFQPGKLAWRPILGVGRAIVVHDLRVAGGPHAPEAVDCLWGAVLSFAQYFGFPLVTAIIGTEPGLIAPDHAPGRGWITCDAGAGDARLVMRVLHGPVAMPRLPRDWAGRARDLGPGLVIVTSGESAPLEARAQALRMELAPRGVAIRHIRACDGPDLRARALTPGAAYAVSCDGRHLGGAELGADDLLRAALGCGAGDYSPS